MEDKMAKATAYILVLLFSAFTVGIQVLLAVVLSTTPHVPTLVIYAILLSMVVSGFMAFNALVQLTNSIGVQIDEETAKQVFGVLVLSAGGLWLAYRIIDGITSILVYAFLR
jgi:hypothetical protein